jgi:hypothetical protein
MVNTTMVSAGQAQNHTARNGGPARVYDEFNGGQSLGHKKNKAKHGRESEEVSDNQKYNIKSFINLTPFLVRR